MQTATIIRIPPGRYEIRMDPKGAQAGGDVTVIEVLQQKDGESLEEFKERCVRFVREECP